MPKVQAALELYDLLKVSNTDLRQPVGLEEQLLKDDAMDTEVGQSMLQLLQVSPLPRLECINLHTFIAACESKLAAVCPLFLHAPVHGCVRCCGHKSWTLHAATAAGQSFASACKHACIQPSSMCI